MKYLFLVVAVALLGSALVGELYGEEGYRGKEVFQTEEAYSQFKTVIGSPEVDIVECSALTSKPPIVVTFTVWVPRDQEFPYGSTDRVGMIVATGLFGLASLACFAAFGYFQFFEKD